MTMNAGVWIDHYKAVVVLLTDEGQEMLQIRSDRGACARSPAGLRANNFVEEGRREGDVTIFLNRYYDDVIACVRDAQAILILGPTEAKREFRTRIVRQRLRGHVAEMTTVADLTDQQIADYVCQHFQ